jgi:hypothetical protein
MHAFFLLDAESSPRVTARPQILLHPLADRDIFDLDLMAKLN